LPNIARGNRTVIPQLTTALVNKIILPVLLVRCATNMASGAMPHQMGGSADSVGDAATFGVVTVSDRASGGVYQDLSGPAILQFLADAVHSQ
jgi:hypothetical protein